MAGLARYGRVDSNPDLARVASAHSSGARVPAATDLIPSVVCLNFLAAVADAAYRGVAEVPFQQPLLATILARRVFA